MATSRSTTSPTGLSSSSAAAAIPRQNRGSPRSRDGRRLLHEHVRGSSTGRMAYEGTDALTLLTQQIIGPLAQQMAQLSASVQTLAAQQGRPPPGLQPQPGAQQAPPGLQPQPGAPQAPPHREVAKGSVEENLKGLDDELKKLVRDIRVRFNRRLELAEKHEQIVQRNLKTKELHKTFKKEAEMKWQWPEEYCIAATKVPIDDVITKRLNERDAADVNMEPGNTAAAAATTAAAAAVPVDESYNLVAAWERMRKLHAQECNDFVHQHSEKIRIFYAETVSGEEFKNECVRELELYWATDGAFYSSQEKDEFSKKIYATMSLIYRTSRVAAAKKSGGLEKKRELREKAFTEAQGMYQEASSHTLMAMAKLSKGESEEKCKLLEFLCAQQPHLIKRFKDDLKASKTQQRKNKERRPSTSRTRKAKVQASSKGGRGRPKQRTPAPSRSRSMSKSRTSRAATTSSRSSRSSRVRSRSRTSTTQRSQRSKSNGSKKSSRSYTSRRSTGSTRQARSRSGSRSGSRPKNGQR